MMNRAPLGPFGFCMNQSVGKVLNDDDGDQSNENEQREIIRQFETKMITLFSIWETETNRKLDILGQMITDLDENIDKKLFTLRNNILDKVEEYIGGKFNNLQINITEALKQNVDCNSDVLDKKTFETFQENINYKFDVLANNISNCKPDALEKVTNLGNNVNQKLCTPDKKIPTNFYENINIKLNASANNISEELEGHCNCMSNFTNVTDVTSDKPTHSNKTLSDKDCSITHTLETPAVVETTPKESIKLPCKEETLNNDTYTSRHYSIDNETLKHATMRRDSAGLLSYFEMHVAIQTDSWVYIKLGDKDHSDIFCEITIGYANNQYTDLYNHEWTRIQHVHTPDILSTTQYRAFYIKVDNGKLEFGKKGDSSPLVSHYDARFSSLNYFMFFYNGVNTSKIRYDCPESSLTIS